jgi:hypothetical protein
VSLNPAQRTAVRSTLLQLEQALDETERLLDGPPTGVTYIIEADFSPAIIAELRQTCQETRRQIAELVTAFDLPVQRRYARRLIVAGMSNAWVNLEEVRPVKLRRYGQVDVALDQTLTPRLERLIHTVLAIQELASRED